MSVTHRSYENHELSFSELPSTVLSLTAGYALGQFAADTGLGLQQSWAASDCIFLFLRANATDFEGTLSASFTAKLIRYLLDPLHRQVRFLWIENPLAPLSQWHTHELSVAADQEGPSVISQLSYVDL